MHARARRAGRRSHRAGERPDPGLCGRGERRREIENRDASGERRAAQAAALARMEPGRPARAESAVLGRLWVLWVHLGRSTGPDRLAPRGETMTHESR